MPRLEYSLAPRLPFEERLPATRLGDWRARSARPASLAVVSVSLLILVLVSGAFWAGRMIEQRSQFGKALMLAPALEDLTAATRFQDSVSMQYVLQMGRLRRHR